MNSYDLEHLSIAEHVCLRPGLYTANGSLSEVLALLDGYRLAVQTERHPTSDVSPIQTLDWLANEIGLDQNTKPTERVGAILARFGNENAAIQAMLKHAKTLRTCESEPTVVRTKSRAWANFATGFTM